MILKHADNKDDQIAELKRIIDESPTNARSPFEQELRTLQSGIDGEKESSYLIDFEYASSNKMMVIHDLRLEIDGRVAQIDHLLINRALDVIVLETKNFRSGVKITEEGEFLRWNDYKRTYEGMASPIHQNERHIAVLKDAISQIELPRRLGVRVSPAYHSFVLVAPKARIIRPEKFDSSCVIKADSLRKTIQQMFDKESVLQTLGSISRVVSTETLEGIGIQLVDLHRPAHSKYAERLTALEKDYGVQVQGSKDVYTCRRCGSQNISIQHGRYGYYFKCGECDGNTPIKIGCGQDGHQERIRKQGEKFFRECAVCDTSSLYFVNKG